MIAVDVQLDHGDFNLDVAFDSDASVLGVFGPSGAGKTTLINLIAGLHRPTRGTITVAGRVVFDDGDRVDVPVHQRRLGVVFQEHRLFPHYSVSGNLLYGATGADGPFDSIVDLLELRPLLARRVRQLSGGERQRVALGRALLSDPSMLLLDEPLASLDHRLRRQIIPYLQRIRDDLAIPMVYVSHELTEVLQLTDTLLVLDAGKAVGCGRYTELIHEEAVLSALHDRGMTNVLPAVVADVDTDHGVMRVAVGDEGSGTHLIVPCLPDAVPGQGVTASIQPWDIALAADRIDGVSIQNQVVASITRCTWHPRRVLVEVDLGVPVIVEVSRRSAASMKLEVGGRVVCLVKSHAVRVMSV